MTSWVLDVEFLLNPMPFDKHVIYRFTLHELVTELRTVSGDCGLSGGDSE